MDLVSYNRFYKNLKFILKSRNISLEEFEANILKVPHGYLYLFNDDKKFDTSSYEYDITTDGYLYKVSKHINICPYILEHTDYTKTVENKLLELCNSIYLSIMNGMAKCDNLQRISDNEFNKFKSRYKIDSVKMPIRRILIKSKFFFIVEFVTLVESENGFMGVALFSGDTLSIGDLIFQSGDPKDARSNEYLDIIDTLKYISKLDSSAWIDNCEIESLTTYINS